MRQLIDYIIVKPMLSVWQLSNSWRANRRSIPLYLCITPRQELTLCIVLTLHKRVNRSWDIGAKRHCLLALLVLNFQCWGSPLLDHMIWVTKTTTPMRLGVKFILSMPSSLISDSKNSVHPPSQNIAIHTSNFIPKYSYIWVLMGVPWGGFSKVPLALPFPKQHANTNMPGSTNKYAGFLISTIC